jgi:ATP-dependent helicase/nuclease subunit A
VSRNFVPSEEQRRAISARDSELLISAGAGSGKTRVLTERLMSYLNDTENPCDIGEFLIITYTRAAAAELRERIRGAIAEELAESPNNRRLRRQAALVHSAQIDTIHGFCANIIRENAHFLELSPDFRVAEADEASVIETAVMDRLLDERYERIEEFTGFENLVDALSPGRDDERLGEIALSLYTNLRSHHNGRAWLENTLRALDPDTYSDAAETPWGKVLIAKARRSAEFWDSRLGEILAEIAGDEAVMKKYGNCYPEALNALQMLIMTLDGKWDEICSAAVFETTKPPPIRITEDGERARLAWTEFGREKKKIAEIFYAPSNEILGDMRTVHGIIAALFALVEDFAAAFTAEKKRRRLVDFSDLEHYALQLLTDEKTREPTALARDISLRYKEIMVDEYQDVSLIQEHIFGAVSRGGRNLVTVGDMRQSIYRFRLAEPSIFQNKYDTYPDDRLIRLTRNFRSHGSILDAVNFVFSNVMSKAFGEMDYTEKEYLYPGADEAAGGGRVELALISAGVETDGDEEEPADVPGKREVEARFIANRIRELTQSGEFAFRDCVILLRAMSNAGIYRAALAGAGIPVVSPPSESYFDSAEVELALAFLTIIDNPRNDIPLTAVLRSRLYNFTPDELADIRVGGGEADYRRDFLPALEEYAETSDKARAFLDELREYRALAPEYGAERVLWRLYNRAELPALASSLPNGGERRDNLMRLIRDARRAAAIGYGGVAEFLRYIERVRERGTKLSDDDAGNDNAVRILTIHKSKGLEFPVVFLADCARQLRKTDEKDLLMFHRELGIGVKRVDLERKIAYSTLPRLAITEKLNEEMMSEELRVLYVAMTRARERLIITYADKDTEKLTDKLLAQTESPVPPYILSNQTKFGNFLLLAALTPRGEEFFDIRRVTAAEVAAQYAQPHFATPADPDAPEEITLPETVIYAFAAATALPSKLTVTELKNRAADAEITDESETDHRKTRREVVFDRPKFIAAEPLTGAERGTALHLALRHLELREYVGEADIRAAVDALAERGMLTEEQAEAADAGALLRFFQSDLGRKSVAAEDVFREFKFSLLVDAEQFFAGGGDDKILFQGVVDLAFRDGDALTIVDFKSDKLYGGNAISEKTEMYAPQLRAYADAMERVTDLRVRECALYFLDKGIAVTVENE